VLSSRGLRLAKKFHAVGRDVIGIDTPETIKVCEFPIDYLNQLLISPDPISMASAISSMHGHCGIIECPPKKNKYTFKEIT
jgi:hypothetical protein